MYSLNDVQHIFYIVLLTDWPRLLSHTNFIIVASTVVSNNFIMDTIMVPMPNVDTKEPVYIKYVTKKGSTVRLLIVAVVLVQIVEIVALLPLIYVYIIIIIRKSHRVVFGAPRVPYLELLGPNMRSMISARLLYTSRKRSSRQMKIPPYTKSHLIGFSRPKPFTTLLMNLIRGLAEIEFLYCSQIFTISDFDQHNLCVFWVPNSTCRAT